MKVLAFGEVLRDVYPDSAVLGGAPLNFSAHCVKCGGEGYVFSGVGKDQAGKEVLDEIRSMNVNTDFIDSLHYNNPIGTADTHHNDNHENKNYKGRNDFHCIYENFQIF